MQEEDYEQSLEQQGTFKVKSVVRKFKKQNIKNTEKEHNFKVSNHLSSYCRVLVIFPPLLHQNSFFFAQKEIGSMVINQSYILSGSPCQTNSMLIIQSISGTKLKIHNVNLIQQLDRPYLFQNDPSLVMAPFMSFTSQNHNTEHKQSPERLNVSYSSPVMLRKTTTDSSIASQSEQMSAKGLIIKEKIIKKPANRPTSYLTERKYYLAQPCPNNQNSERKLRPRKIKKKHHQNAIVLTSKQEQKLRNDVAQGKNQEAVLEVDPLEKKVQELYPIIVSKKVEKSNPCTINEGEAVAEGFLQ